jgi:phytanoyl-CoA hydroxylase
VGLWLAVTDATLENGCLWVVPGTQADPVHEHVFGTRRDSPYKYMEIVDQDTSAEISVTINDWVPVRRKGWAGASEC